MRDKKVSIIVPAYNAGKSIKRCLQSLICQTYKSLEIIVINDGSNDETADIVGDMQKTDSRIILINNNNRGVSYSRNYGIKIANGDFILFVDSDDYLDIHMIEKMIYVQKLHNADIVQCGYMVTSNDKCVKSIVDKRYCYEGDRRIEFYLNNLELCVVPWNKISKKKIWENIKFPENRRYEDEATMFKCFYEGKVIENLDEPLYYYVQNDEGFMNSSSNNKKIYDLVLAKEDMYKYISEVNYANAEKAQNEFTNNLFHNYIRAICERKDEENDFYRKKIRIIYKKYYEIIKKNSDIKVRTAFLLRYFPILIYIKDGSCDRREIRS